jgi:fatty-acyl-CoA synthase
MSHTPPDLAFEPLTPLAYLRRVEHSHGERVGVVDGDRSLTYAELADRCRRLAGVVRACSDGRPAAVLSPNSTMLLEAHFGIPWAGVPMVPLNLRLTADELAYMIGHSDAGLLLCDASLREKGEAIAAKVDRPLTVLVDDGPGGAYEAALADATPTEIWPEDERSVLAINYTSGTTGRPKGALYHHRGAFLQALAMVGHTGLGPSSVHLWTLPMFHCNGWCFPWAVTGAAARHVCLRKVEPEAVWSLIRSEGVTHFEGAPTVLTMLASSDAAEGGAGRPIRAQVGGAPPSPAVLARMAELGVDVTHLYGLTETFGPAAICDWKPAWDALDGREQARLRARQGVGNMISVPLRVVDADGADVPADGQTSGEIAIRGNNVMLGYLDDPDATRAAAPDGWFRTGDVAVMHPDGYLEIRDRSKDVIISGGENISSVEVENVLADHPGVLEAAVVGAPDERWGEVPVAYVTVREGAVVDADALRDHVRSRLAGFKVPKRVVFDELPKTATGKVQKYVLRERASRDARC